LQVAGNIRLLYWHALDCQLGPSLPKHFAGGLIQVLLLQVDASDTTTQAIHANAEVFNPNAENFYKYAQIFSACADAFAHGANDVANSIGPFAAMYYVYRNNGKIGSNSDAPKWILVIGGLGIVVGLATYGYNIMKVLGQKTIKITPSRGFCIEMSTAMIVAVGSALGIPLSTTQCQVGGTWGVGLVEGSGGINWRLSIKIFAGWVATLFLTAGLAGALFAQGVYSPTLVADVVPPKSSSPK
jgi:solute carrier family 20 (sodium-dependent phosphate transporter)